MSSAIKYRPEIDGLRALAVVAVIVFHLNPAWLKGGFLGVDVFFVISGYLITAIIQRNIDAGKFSLSQFWLRRIRRLYPALMAMVCAVALAANFLLIRPERIDLIKQSIGAIFSFSNILLWKTTNGYWSSSSDNIALLHTWSLSLEEQFYIFFPALLLLLNKLFRKSVIPVIVLLTLGSLAFSIYWTPIDRSGAFYLLPTRLWELTIGSLLAMAELFLPKWNRSSRAAPTLAAIGIAAVIVSFITLKNDADFPKAVPLLPCIGTVFVLAFGHNSGIANRMLRISPMSFLGRISYSLYLWHWPVIVLSHYVTPESSTAALLLLTLLLASASYYMIENPFRIGFRGSMAVIVAMPAVAGLCLLPIFLKPVSPGVPAQLLDLESPDSLTRSWQYEASQRILDGDGGVTLGADHGEPSIVLVGSSHARVLGEALNRYAQQNELAIEVLATSGVEVTRKGSTIHKANAGEINEARTSYLRNLRPDTMIIAGMWSAEYNEPTFTENLAEILRLASESSQQVLVLAQVPMFDLPTSYKGAFRKYLVASARAAKPLSIHSSRSVGLANQAVEQAIESLRLSNVKYVDTYNPLLNEDGSIKYLIDGKFLYADYHHVNSRGAEHLFESVIRPALEKGHRLVSKK